MKPNTWIDWTGGFKSTRFTNWPLPWQRHLWLQEGSPGPEDPRGRVGHAVRVRVLPAPGPPGGRRRGPRGVLPGGPVQRRGAALPGRAHQFGTRGWDHLPAEAHRRLRRHPLLRHRMGQRPVRYDHLILDFQISQSLPTTKCRTWSESEAGPKRIQIEIEPKSRYLGQSQILKFKII